MYRNIVDNAVTYTQDDVVLFRESPFAAWMERLTLENPDHGIPPDINSIEPRDCSDQQGEIVTTLRAEGRNVALIVEHLDEPERRAATLAAMRSGVDFIVNGQLAEGNLSGSANLLMRTSGYSQLGDFLYIPCATHITGIFQSAFRLCFAADLLHSLQDQLPPQMLIIRNGAEVVPLQTDDYIYYYRAVLKRFMHAMNNFRKHRMPDPAESSHFGRWSECANEVLKQRALRAQHQAEEQLDEVQEEMVEMPQRLAAGSAASMQSFYDTEVMGHPDTGFLNPTKSTLQESSAADRSDAAYPTLAEQALALTPGSYRSSSAPGHTPNLTRFSHLRPVAPAADNQEQQHNRRSTDAALQNLEFIGSSPAEPLIDCEPPTRWREAQISAPPPNLRETQKRDDRVPELSGETAPGLPELEPGPPLFLPPDNSLPLDKSTLADPPPERLKLHPLSGESDGIKVSGNSMIDLDSAPTPVLAPVVQRAEAEFDRLIRNDFPLRNPEATQSKVQPEEDSTVASPFSNSLHTSREFNDR